MGRQCLIVGNKVIIRLYVYVCVKARDDKSECYDGYSMVIG